MRLTDEEERVVMSVASRQIEEIARQSRLNTYVLLTFIVTQLVFAAALVWGLHVLDANDLPSKLVAWLEAYPR